MFNWFFNLFRRKTYEERLTNMCRREHDSAGRDIKRTPETPDQLARWKPLDPEARKVLNDHFEELL